MNTLIFLASLFGTYGDPMQLVDKNTGKVILEFKDEAVTFYSPFLEAQFEERGILIPPLMQPEFQGKQEVLLGDPLFKKAFIEIYLPFYMAGANSPYEWKK